MKRALPIHGGAARLLEEANPLDVPANAFVVVSASAANEARTFAKQLQEALSALHQDVSVVLTANWPITAPNLVVAIETNAARAGLPAHWIVLPRARHGFAKACAARVV